MSTVCGIDYDSEAVFLVLVDEDTLAFVSSWKADLACGPGDAFARARRVPLLMPSRSMLENMGVAAFAIELPYSRFPASLVAHMRVQGAILACLPRDLPVTELRPQTWKKHTVGKSNAAKPDVKAWALEQGCPPELTQDFYDAFAIARAHLAIGEVEAAA